MYRPTFRLSYQPCPRVSSSGARTKPRRLNPTPGKLRGGQTVVASSFQYFFGFKTLRKVSSFIESFITWHSSDVFIPLG